jgi:hypothetical protein
MPNAIKYNTSAETLALKKGNFWIGTGDVGKGPTNVTGYYNGITPPTGGFTIYLNKESGGPSIYTVTTEAELTGLTNTLSVSTNLIKNNNGGNFADGTIAPFTGAYGTLPTIVDITNDKPYYGSTSTKAAKFVAGGGMNIYTDPSPFTMTVGVTYTFSFWYRQTNANQFNIGFNNQGGNGDVNGNFQAYSVYGYFAPPTQTWQRCSWTFTNVIDKVYFFIYDQSSAAGSECLMTEFTLTEGSMPGGPGLATSGNCLNWFASVPTDKMIFNRDYESIVTSGLTLNLDAGFSPSFATIPLNSNNSTVTPWYDLSGNGNNGTLVNGPTFSSANSGSIVFDGVDDYATVTSLNLTGITENFTFITVIKFPTFNNVGAIVWQAFSSYWALMTNTSVGAANLTFTTRGTRGQAAVSSTLTANQWYYVVCKREGGVNSLYINNTVYTYTSDVSFPGDTLFTIGTTGTSYWFDGNLALIQLYNRALSASEITQNYNATKSRFGL